MSEETMIHFALSGDTWAALSDNARDALIELYMKDQRPALAGDPKTDQVCEFGAIEGDKVVWCDLPSTYRITKYSDRQILQDDGSWKKERTEEYVCKKHFDKKYVNNEYCTSKDLGTWTYKRFVSTARARERVKDYDTTKPGLIIQSEDGIIIEA